MWAFRVMQPYLWLRNIMPSCKYSPRYLGRSWMVSRSSSWPRDVEIWSWRPCWKPQPAEWPAAAPLLMRAITAFPVQWLHHEPYGPRIGNGLANHQTRPPQLFFPLTPDLVAGVKTLQSRLFPKPRPQSDPWMGFPADLEDDKPQPNQELFLLTVTVCQRP